MYDNLLTGTKPSAVMVLRAGEVPSGAPRSAAAQGCELSGKGAVAPVRGDARAEASSRTISGASRSWCVTHTALPRSATLSFSRGPAARSPVHGCSSHCLRAVLARASRAQLCGARACKRNHRVGSEHWIAVLLPPQAFLVRFHPQHVTGPFLFLYAITSFGLLLADAGADPSPGRLLTTQHRDSDAEASLVPPLLPPPGWAA